MITNLAKKIVDSFIADSEIAGEDRELFIYGLFILISKIHYFLLTLLFGCIFNVAVESIVFYMLFTLLRGYAGGIHASSETICMISTPLSMFASVLVISVGSKIFQTIPFACMLFVNSVIIIFLGPQDSPQKPLAEVEKRLYKRNTVIIVFLVLFIAGIALSIHLQYLFVCCSVTITLESILLLLGCFSAIKNGGSDNVKN